MQSQKRSSIQIPNYMCITCAEHSLFPSFAVFISLTDECEVSDEGLFYFVYRLSKLANHMNPCERRELMHGCTAVGELYVWNFDSLFCSTAIVHYR